MLIFVLSNAIIHPQNFNQMQTTTNLPDRLSLFAITVAALIIIGYLTVPALCELFSQCTATMETYWLDIIKEAESAYPVRH